jgi:predicted CXXCH cytochrome family protein
VHGGAQIFLWAKTIPDDAGLTEMPVCYSCHSRDGPAAEKSVGAVSHPINVSPADKGLTTRLPLFDPRHRLAPDGRMTCYSCHDPHRWDSSPAVSDTSNVADGDARNSFLRLAGSPSPHLCVDCHQKQSRVGRTDHDLTITAPRAKNNAGQNPLQSGPCGVCHATHNGENQLLLWAQEFGHGSNVMETLCTGCHSRSGAASDKIPAVVFHPEDIAIHNTGRNIKHDPVYFPLYHAASGQPQNAGNLSCPSCHNAHRWSPIEDLPNAAGKNREGDVLSSFLRNASYNTICMDCHGPEALYRYQYFHLPAKR